MLKNLAHLFLASSAMTLLAGAVAAQRPGLVKDMNRTPPPDPSSNPGPIVSLGTVFLFSADAHDEKGRELYRSLGTNGTTQLVKDIAPGEASSNPLELTATSNAVYFVADDGQHGPELWASDGTKAGTRMVKDVNKGAGTGAHRALAAVGNTVFFAGEDGVSGRELWKSDGTAAGTVLVKDIANQFIFGSPSWLTPFGGKLVFVAGDSSIGLELWITDGTTAGTVLLKDIAPGAGGSSPRDLKVIGNKLYFSAQHPSVGRELYVTDGTAAGTVLVADIQAGVSGSAPGAFAPLGNTGAVLFRASDARGAELWRTDGTAAGTWFVADLDPRIYRGRALSSSPQFLTPLGNVILLSAYSQALGHRVWRSDGTPAGTQLVGSLTPFWSQSPPLQLGTKLLFRAKSRGLPTGLELFLSDGTTAGTTLVKDIRPGLSPSSIRWLTKNSSGRIVFSAYDGTTGSELWTTDGTTNGTNRVDNLAQVPAGHTLGSNPHQLVDAFGSTFFFANYYELWKTDSTTAGTVMLKKFQVVSNLCPCPSELTVVGDELFFRVRSVLWKTDGTAQGTVAVKDVDPGSTGAWSSHFTAMGGKLYFAAQDRRAGTGRELWTSDGTAAGTVMVKDVAPGPTGSFLANLVAVGQTLFFTANDGTHGTELFRSDGTAAGTVLVKDINPGGVSSIAANLVRFGGLLYFRARTTTHGSELWKSDGTAAGTVLVSDVVPGTFGSSPSELTPVGDLLFFLGLEWQSGTGWKPRVWRTDGTAAGTVRVSPLVSEGIVAYGDSALLFSGASIQRSNGTAAGTVVLKTFASAPRFIEAKGSGARFVWFTANESATGAELWRTDGTTAGTNLVANMNKAAKSSDPRELTMSRGWLLFSADNGVTGHELWKYDPGASSQTLGTGCAAGSRLHEIRSTDPVLGQTLTITGRGATPGVPTWIAVGVGPAVTLFGGGCEVYLVLGTELLVGPFTPNTSSWNYNAPLANAPVFIGITAVVQAVQSPTNGPFGLDLTNGMALTFGR